VEAADAGQIHAWFSRMVAMRISEAGDVFTAGQCRFVLTDPDATATHATAVPAESLARIGTPGQWHHSNPPGSTTP
jgi:hypothetical protein